VQFEQAGAAEVAAVVQGGRQSIDADGREQHGRRCH